MFKPRTLGQKLRELRENKDMSQGEIAKMIGILTESYGKWERDTIRKIDTERLQKLADFYGVTLDYFLKSEYNLDHLSDELQEFIYNPESKNYIAKAYLEFLKNKYNLED